MTTLGPVSLSLTSLDTSNDGGDTNPAFTPCFKVEGVYEELSVKNGLSGIVTLENEGKDEEEYWKITGEYYNASLAYSIKNNRNCFKINLEKGSNLLTGKWYKGDTSGEWEGLREKDCDSFRLTKEGHMGHIGTYG